MWCMCVIMSVFGLSSSHSMAEISQLIQYTSVSLTEQNVLCLTCLSAHNDDSTSLVMITMDSGMLVSSTDSLMISRDVAESTGYSWGFGFTRFLLIYSSIRRLCGINGATAELWGTLRSTGELAERSARLRVHSYEFRLNGCSVDAFIVEKVLDTLGYVHVGCGVMAFDVRGWR